MLISLSMITEIERIKKRNRKIEAEFEALQTPLHHFLPPSMDDPFLGIIGNEKWVCFTGSSFVNFRTEVVRTSVYLITLSHVSLFCLLVC